MHIIYQIGFKNLFIACFVWITFSDAYLESVYSEMQGRRPTMEDAHSCLQLDTFMPKKAFFGLYDGHGGDMVAEIAAGKRAIAGVRSLHDLLSSVFKEKNIQAQAFTQAFCAFDQDVLACADDSGTTAVVAVVDTCNDDAHELWLAWTGDSRAVVVSVDGTVVYETNDHNIIDPVEAARLKQVRAVITWGAVPRICGLAMPRSLGDRRVKMRARFFADGNDVVIPDPSVHHMILTEQHQVLILACDGVWDVVTSQEAAQFVHNRLQEFSLQEVAQALRDLAYNKGSTDNISVMLISLIK